MGLGQSFGHLRRTSRERRGLPAVAEGPVRDLGPALPHLPVRLPGLGVLQRHRHVAGLRRSSAASSAAGARRSPLVTPLLVITIAGTLASQFVPPLRVDRLQAAFSRQRTAVQVGLLGFALLGITTFGPVGVAPFIYYRF